MNSTPDLLNVLKFPVYSSPHRLWDSLLHLRCSFTYGTMWMNSMKCDFSSTSSKSCVINNKTTSVSFGKKPKNCYLKVPVFWVVFPQGGRYFKVCCYFLIFRYQFYITWGKKKAGAIRSIPWVRIFKKIYYMYIFRFTEKGKYIWDIEQDLGTRVVVLIQFWKKQPNFKNVMSSLLNNIIQFCPFGQYPFTYELNILLTYFTFKYFVKDVCCKLYISDFFSTNIDLSLVSKKYKNNMFIKMKILLK